MNYISSCYGSISRNLSRVAFGALACSTLSDLNARVALAATAIGGGAFLSYKGIQDFCHGKYWKGTTKVLLGAGLIAGAGFITYASVTNPADLQSNLAIANAQPIHQDYCTNVAATLWTAGAAYAVQNHMKFDFTQRLQNWVPPLETQSDQIKLRGKTFARKVQKILENGGQIVRLRSSSGVYLIKDAEGRHVAIFKPDDERNFGPNNLGNPGIREPDRTQEDISHNQLWAVAQGNPSKRQSLAKLLDHDTIAPMPDGMIVEIESDRFVDIEAEIHHTRPEIQRKTGYLQEWDQRALGSLADSHPITIELRKTNPNAEIPGEVFTRFYDHPILTEIPLEEYQKICIMNVLLYNQDGHAGNYLYYKDANGQPHIIPIDMDAILPWRLNDLIGPTTHPRAGEPFGPQALDYIRHLDPDVVRDMTLEMNLSEQAHINTKALAIVLQKFSAADLTLADIHTFINDPRPGQKSPLWKIMQETKQNAIDSLPETDKNTYREMEHIRWRIGSKENVSAEDKDRLQEYRLHTEKRLNMAVEKNYWNIFKKKINKAICSLIE